MGGPKSWKKKVPREKKIQFKFFPKNKTFKNTNFNDIFLYLYLIKERKEINIIF